MRVAAFIGSARKKHTHRAAELLLQKLQSLGKIEYEIVSLSEYNLKTCVGCALCCNKGEEYCPLEDDRDILIQKMINSDGVVFASPNYCFQVSALMKVFVDRLGFMLHRPRFFGKTFTSIVAQGIYGGRDIVKYFNFIGNALGFNVVKGCCIRSLEPLTEKNQKYIDKAIDRLSNNYYSQLKKMEYPTPSLINLMAFRMGRASRKIMLNENDRDFAYFRGKGWFESDYYYPAKIGPMKKVAGKLFDMIGARMARNH